LDKDFEEGISNRASELQREAQAGINRAQKEAQAGIAGAQKYAYEKSDEIDAMINEHPKAYVLGAFIGGVVLGNLLSKGSK
jgi:ElaB/YqjD/DUF883 family membrane-anchored ribosome-binding protein